MHYNYFTEKLINLQGVIVKDVIQKEKETEIHIDLVKKECTCPKCKSTTSKVHDYRIQKIKDVPTYLKHTVLVLRKRRYVCKNCGKRFYEKLEFLPKYHRMSIRVVESIFEQLATTVSYTQVAKNLNLSTSTVIRIFDHLNYAKPTKMPVALGIDEFKGNAGGEKYLAILTDVENNKVIDILPDRKSNSLSKYFLKVDKTNTKYFICDMWKPYRELKNTKFQSAKLITDKFHFVRQVIWDFEKVRKNEQKKFSRKYRLTFKRSKSLLTKRYYKLKPEQKQQARNIFRISPTLEEAHSLKEMFLDILSEKDFTTQKTLLEQWIWTATCYDIKEFKSSITAIQNWFESITNAFEFNYSNGFTEGCNNKIKVLKRVSYGVSNFKRFRNRILHIFNY